MLKELVHPRPRKTTLYLSIFLSKKKIFFYGDLFWMKNKKLKQWDVSTNIELQGNTHFKQNDGKPYKEFIFNFPYLSWKETWL